MIYITYFANIRNLPQYIKPISIAVSPPKGYTGLKYSPLYPTWDMVSNYKNTKDKGAYIEKYNAILNKLKPTEVVLDLLASVGNFKGLNYTPEIALVCYEKSDDFCHRHLVADWLIDNGYGCIEFKSK